MSCGGLSRVIRQSWKSSRDRRKGDGASMLSTIRCDTGLRTPGDAIEKRSRQRIAACRAETHLVLLSGPRSSHDLHQKVTRDIRVHLPRFRRRRRIGRIRQTRRETLFPHLQPHRRGAERRQASAQGEYKEGSEHGGQGLHDGMGGRWLRRCIVVWGFCGMVRSRDEVDLSGVPVPNDIPLNEETLQPWEKKVFGTCEDHGRLRRTWGSRSCGQG